MDKQEQKSSFWTTLPGILTGTAALITAITGLTLGLFQQGFFGSKHEETKPQSAPSTLPLVSEMKSTANPEQANNGAQEYVPLIAQATVLVTAQDGTTTTVFGEGFHQRGSYDGQIYLLDGQAVQISKIAALEITKVFAERAEISMTLVNGQHVAASIGSGSSVNAFEGENDLGTFSIRVEELKRLEFRR